jgi:hypothetical protein
MSVKVIKSITGEEVVGDVTETAIGYVVENPVLVVMQRMQNGETGLGFVPYIPYTAEKKVEFVAANVVHVLEVDDSMRNQYNTIFGGIVTPPKQLLI